MTAPEDDALPGTDVTAVELRQLGFEPFELAFTVGEIALPGGAGCRWDTLGDVPDSPGLYAFTVAADGALRVTYVGLTTHLWMMTKGRVPGPGGGRGGNRYGRPVTAGVTRQRVNVLIAEQVALGRTVTHWLSPRPADSLRLEEERLINQWDLRRSGWNRG